MDVVSSILVTLFGTFAAVVATRGLARVERLAALLAFAAHVAASVLHWVISEFFYGVNDAREYNAFGQQIAKLLDFDFIRFGPEVVKLALHMDFDLPFDVRGAASSTGTMSAIAGFLIFVAGPSLLVMNLLTTCVSWYGQVCLYRVAREELKDEDLGAARVAFLLVPSVIYWGAGFVKEAYSFAAFGVLAWSTHRLLRHRRLVALFGVALGGVGVAMLKPFTLFAYVLAAAAFLYTDRAWRAGQPLRVRPGYLLLAGTLAGGGVLGMGQLFPQYSTTNVAETMAAQQHGGLAVASQGYGGSNVDVGNADATTLREQVTFVPLATVNVFFRPVLLEAKNGPMIGAAMENALLLAGLLSLALTARGRSAAASALRTPMLASGVVFTLLFGIGVGLATTNLGTLSRYRMPMMPFYAATVLVLTQRARRAAKVVERRPVFNPRRPGVA